MINFKTFHTDYLSIVSFKFENEIIPSDLFSLTPPDPIANNFAHKGVILSGRGRVWLFCFLTHFYHPTKFIATYDPRLQGAVVVESHGSKYKVGDIIPVDASLITNKI